MSRDPSTRALTAEEHRLVTAAERDLDRLLSIQPSAELAAKVRARIAADSAAVSAGWRFRWVALAAAGALVIVLAAVLTVATLPSKPDLTAGVEPIASGTAAQPAGVPTPASVPAAEGRDVPPIPAGPGGTRANPAAAHRSRRIEVPPAAPEVLIDRQRRDALDRLLTMVRRGVTGLPLTSPEARDLTVPPVVIEDLEVPLLHDSAGMNEVNAARR